MEKSGSGPAVVLSWTHEFGACDGGSLVAPILIPSLFCRRSKLRHVALGGSWIGTLWRANVLSCDACKFDEGGSF